MTPEELKERAKLEQRLGDYRRRIAGLEQKLERAFQERTNLEAELAEALAKLQGCKCGRAP